MPFKQPVDSGERLGQVIAIMADMKKDGDALEDMDGPLCGRHVTRIIATAEMVAQACYNDDAKPLMAETLMVVAVATVTGKCPLNAIERFLNEKLRGSHAQLMH